ncbi:MAG: SUMF1/EgtB/PvdO family nonheme iron enzyme, partial [Verrucomicrobiota bacterium]
QGITTEPYALTVEELVSVKVPLEPLPSQAEIWTIPNGAEIAVNGVARGQSPIRLTGLPSEVPLTITASLEGRRSESQSITLEPNSGVVIDFGEFEMQQAFIMPKIALSGETDPQIVDLIDISLDGETVTLNETGLLELAPGSHRLAASHPDYRSAEQVFEIQDAEEVELSMILEPKPGIVRVLGPLPENAKLLVNRRAVEFPRSGEILMAVTPRREHEVVIEALNYHPFRTLVTIDPNRTQDLVPTLERIAGPERETSWTLPYIQMQMVWIPTGQFSFGSPLPEHARLPNEGPIRTRNMESSFWIGAHEVTQRIYRAVMQKNPSLFEGLENPVDSVSWDDAMAFCAKLTEIEREAERLPVGYEYRLPSEAEWEYAARAGTNSPYFWGGYAHNSLGNFSGVYPRGSSYDGQGRDHYGTIQVGSFAANPWGLFDVHGNVREWTLDVYGSKPPRELDLGIGNTSDFLRRTQRGGGWEDNAPACRSAARLAVSPELQSHAVGFRVVLAKKVDSTEG